MSNDWKAPTGALIVGTRETVPGTAMITGISDDGEPEYVGETDMDWNEQKTVLRDGKKLFEDENGELWTFDQLTKCEQAGCEEQGDA